MPLNPPRKPPEDEQRLIVLYVLQCLSPCTELQLLQFLSEESLMNYFDMMFALQDLCARGQAVRTAGAAGHLYTPTEAGKEALRLFGGRVPQSVKNALSETGEAWRQRFEREDQFRWQMKPTDQGDWELTLTISEKERELLSLRLPLPTREAARRLADAWPQKAEEIYASLILSLSEEEK